MRNELSSKFVLRIFSRKPDPAWESRRSRKPLPIRTFASDIPDRSAQLGLYHLVIQLMHAGRTRFKVCKTFLNAADCSIFVFICNWNNICNWCILMAQAGALSAKIVAYMISFVPHPTIFDGRKQRRRRPIPNSRMLSLAAIFGDKLSGAP